MPSDVETEFRLRAANALEIAAIDAAVREAGFAARDARTRRHVDVYLDDAVASLQRAGIGLRQRSSSDAVRLTGKVRGGNRGDGRFVREEWDFAWHGADAPRTAADLPPPLRDVIEPHTLDRPLREVLRLATWRDQRLLGQGGRDLAELAIDRVEARAAGRSATFCEVEIEVLDDLATCELLADRLARDLPLHAAPDDKPAHAATLLGLQSASDGERLHDAMPVEAAFARLAQRQLTVLQHAEAGVRSRGRVEDVHELRVAARRLRELVHGLADAWSKPERRRWVALLRAIGRRFGAARELDVLQARLPRAIGRLPAELQPQGPPLLAWLAERRSAAMTEAQAWLRAPERLAEQREFGDAVLRLATSGAEAPLVAEALPARLGQAARRVRRRARRLPAELPLEPLHELRIACKRLRYLAEAFAPLRGPAFTDALATVTAAQQRLGKVCDADDAGHRLLAWIDAAPATGADAHRTAALLGALAADAFRRGRSARRRAEREVERLRRRRCYRDLLQ